MSLPLTLPAAPAPSAAGGLRRSIRDAAARLGWRVIGTTFAIAIALEAWLFLQVNFTALPRVSSVSQHFLSATVVNLVMAFCIMATTLVADEQVLRGARRLPAYVWSVAAGAALGAIVQWILHELLSLPVHGAAPGDPLAKLMLQPVAVFSEYLIWGSIIVFVYVNRRNAMMALTRLNTVQVERAETKRRTLELRLQVLQARVEPQFLFDTLADVCDLYERDVARGTRLLSALIVFLRAALPQPRDSASTLGHELDLVRNYLDVMAARRSEPIPIVCDAPDDVLRVRVPPMVLLPLVGHLMVHRRASPEALHVLARNDEGRLRVEVSCRRLAGTAMPTDDELQDLRNRLRTLYGDRWTLTFERTAGDDVRAVLEIPDATADSNHR